MAIWNGRRTAAFMRCPAASDSSSPFSRHRPWTQIFFFLTSQRQISTSPPRSSEKRSCWQHRSPPALSRDRRLCDVQPYSIQKGVFHHVHYAGPRFGDSFYHFRHVFRCVNGMAVMLRRGWRRSSGASAQGFLTASVSLPRRQASRPKQQEPAP